MSRHPALTIPILILFLACCHFRRQSLPVPVTDLFCGSGMSFHIASLYDTDQCSDLHTCTSLDLPYHIHFLCPLLGTSYYGTFAVLTGFLCGYPMGAKTTSDLLNVNKISRSEASYLLSFCNNTSPAFILSYVVAQNMKERNLCIPFS